MTIKDRLFVLALLFSGCATHNAGPVVGKSADAVLLETKAQIKDIKADESHTAKIEIIVLPQQAIRLEVTALLGFPVASIVLTPKLIQYSLHTTKQFAEGPFSARTMYPVFKQNIDPRILWNVIHNRSPESADIACTKDASGRPIQCLAANNIVVTWTYDPTDRAQKRIEIRNPQFEMIWVFKSQSAFKLSQNETFVLKKPDDYQVIRLK